MDGGAWWATVQGVIKESDTAEESSAHTGWASEHFPFCHLLTCLIEELAESPSDWHILFPSTIKFVFELSYELDSRVYLF